MCGRYALDGNPVAIGKRFGLQVSLRQITPHFNVAPGMMMPIIKLEKEPVAVLAKWGLIPFWATDPRIGYRMINARAETLAEKPAFRKPFISRRCLVPASGFYEWRVFDKEKVPYFIRLKDAELFTFAGLYDIWKDVEGKQLLTFTIITTAPNKLMEPIHNRMPAILTPQSEKDWLNPDSAPGKLGEMLKPYPEKDMTAHPISTHVNNPDNDTREIINEIKISSPDTLFG
jgi:putative SOS response-associated peptidase YedK